MAEISNSLSRVPIFAGLGDKDLKQLGERMSERTFKEAPAQRRSSRAPSCAVAE